MKFEIEDMLATLPRPATERWPDGVWDIEPLKKGGVTLVFFAPRGVDHQTIHDQDEFYFIVRGTAQIVIEGEATDVNTGDALFVEAGKRHRFESFSIDFATWAVFFN